MRAIQTARGLRDRSFWHGLGLPFIYLSLAEFTMLHERLNVPVCRGALMVRIPANRTRDGVLLCMGFPLWGDGCFFRTRCGRERLRKAVDTERLDQVKPAPGGMR